MNIRELEKKQLAQDERVGDLYRKYNNRRDTVDMVYSCMIRCETKTLAHEKRLHGLEYNFETLDRITTRHENQFANKSDVNHLREEISKLKSKLNDLDSDRCDWCGQVLK